MDCPMNCSHRFCLQLPWVFMMFGKWAVKIYINALVFFHQVPNEPAIIGKIARQQLSSINRAAQCAQGNFACVQQLANFAICGAFQHVHDVLANRAPVRRPRSQRHFFCTFARLPRGNRKKEMLAALSLAHTFSHSVSVAPVTSEWRAQCIF